MILLAAAVLLLLPALWNGFPLLYPDSIEYIETGASVAKALVGIPSGYYGQRSLLYSLALLPLHLHARTLWPVVLAQAALTAWLLELVYRSLLPWQPRRYLGLVALLSLVTPLGWDASLVMPDFTGGLVLLSAYLLGTSLTAGKRRAVFLVLAGSIVCHGSNLLLAAGLCLLPGARHLKVAAIALAVLLQLGVHQRVFHQLSLFGQPPPFLLARLVGDETVCRYLDEQPDAARFALHAHRRRLRPDALHFLWNPEGARSYLRRHHPETWKQVVEQQSALCRAAVLAYPGQQILRSLYNAVEQGLSFDAGFLYSLGYPEEVLETNLPRLAPGYFHSRQHRLGLYLEFWSIAFYLTVLAAVAYLRSTPLPQLPNWQRWRVHILWVLPLQAAVGGCLSTLDPRYQARVIWLLPCWALLLLIQSRGGQTRALGEDAPSGGR